jgi:hypothetical protein
LRPQAPQTLGRGSTLAPEYTLSTGNANPYPQKIDPKSSPATPTSHSPLTHSHPRFTVAAPSAYADSLAPDAGETPGGGWGLAEGGRGAHGRRGGVGNALLLGCCAAGGARAACGESLRGSALVLSGLLCSRRVRWVPCSRLLSSEPPWGFVVSRHKTACSCGATFEKMSTLCEPYACMHVSATTTNMLGLITRVRSLVSAPYITFCLQRSRATVAPKVAFFRAGRGVEKRKVWREKIASTGQLLRFPGPPGVYLWVPERRCV